MKKDPKSHQRKYADMKRKRSENKFLLALRKNINTIQKYLLLSFLVLFLFCEAYNIFFFSYLQSSAVSIRIVYTITLAALEILLLSIPLLFMLRVWKELHYDTLFQFFADFLFCLFFVILHSVKFELNIFTDIFVSTSIINTYVLRLFSIHLTIFLFILFVAIIIFVVVTWLLKASTAAKRRHINMLDSINDEFFRYLKKGIAAIFVLSGFITVTIFGNLITKDIFNEPYEYAILQQDINFYKTLVVSSLFIPTYRYVFNKKDPF